MADDQPPPHPRSSLEARLDALQKEIASDKEEIERLEREYARGKQLEEELDRQIAIEKESLPKARAKEASRLKLLRKEERRRKQSRLDQRKLDWKKWKREREPGSPGHEERRKEMIALKKSLKAADKQKEEEEWKKGAYARAYARAIAEEARKKKEEETRKKEMEGPLAKRTRLTAEANARGGGNAVNLEEAILTGASFDRATRLIPNIPTDPNAPNLLITHIRPQDAAYLEEMREMASTQGFDPFEYPGYFDEHGNMRPGYHFSIHDAPRPFGTHLRPGSTQSARFMLFSPIGARIRVQWPSME